jgi:hypothetical protein
MEILSLNNSSDYSEMVKYFEENKDKPIFDWLEFDGVLDKPGKQGIVGIFRLKNNKELRNCKYLFKLSQYINYLVYHELIVMQGLKEISSYCPHFCKGIGLIETKIDAKYKKNCLNPFEITNKYPIQKDILLCEFLDNTTKFYNYIRSERIHEDVLYSIVKQVLLALTIAQKEKQFTHYDLHSFNVMINKCDKDLVILYILDEENQFCVPTLGSYPIIIDFGFSYIKDMEDGPLWTSMAHTDVGFLSDRFDWVADPKLFLVTVSEEIKDKRNTKKSKMFRRIVKNIFHPLEIDWESGWDEGEEYGATDYILKKLESANKNISTLFYEFDGYCIDILQTLIILPLEKQNTDNYIETYKIFLKEWTKIEKEISNPFYNLYILKGIVDVARNIRPDYYDPQKRKHSIMVFRQEVYNVISNVSKFCIPKNIHFEKLLCSMYVFTKNLEGLFYEFMQERMKRKDFQYQDLPLKSMEQIYGCISTNLPDQYQYNEKTKFLIVDNIKKECNIFKINNKNQNQQINEIPQLAQGIFVYDLYKQQN